MENKKGLEMTPTALAAALSGDMENAIAASTPGGIEAQEAKGQEQLVNSTNMPKRLQAYREFFGENDATVFYKKWGCKIGKDVDEIFIEVELPKGWTKESTDHSMWSVLRDEKGRQRAMIFYKAAFYDRSAELSPDVRFSSYSESIELKEKCYDSYERIAKEERYGVIKDCGKVVYKTKSGIFKKEYSVSLEKRKKSQDYSAGDHREWWNEYDNWKREFENEVKVKLNKRFPKHEDYFAYWDVEDVDFSKAPKKVGRTGKMYNFFKRKKKE